MSASVDFPKVPASWISESKLSANQKYFISYYKNTNSTNLKKRALFIIHGQGEYFDRYLHFPFYLEDTFDVIGGVDLTGHGRSKGARGHINKFKDYHDCVLESFSEFSNHAQSDFQDIEFYWLGHSLGGLIALSTLIENKNLNLKAVAVSAPLLGFQIPVPPIKEFFGRLVEPIFGSLPLGNEIKPEMLSHDVGVQKQVAIDPLNINKVTPRFFVQLTQRMQEVNFFNGEFYYNIQFITALADPLISWKSQMDFFNKLKLTSGKYKKFDSFTNFRHEAFNEVGKERTFLALKSWFLKF